MDISLPLGLTTIIGAVVYAVRLEGRINTQQAELRGHEELDSERLADLKADLADLKSDSKYIRERLDRLVTKG